jgi:hypothetical protein
LNIQLDSEATLPNPALNDLSKAQPPVYLPSHLAGDLIIELYQIKNKKQVYNSDFTNIYKLISVYKDKQTVLITNLVQSV